MPARRCPPRLEGLSKRVSRIKPGHACFGIALASHGARRQGGIDCGKILAGKSELRGRDIFLKISYPSCAGNRDDVFALMQQPSDGELAGRALFCAGKSF